MAKISAIIIAKNEEEVIGDCINSLSFCDEVIVIDDESTDRTIEVAKILNAKVFIYSSKSFAEQRNFGLTKVKSKWVLYVDADERISDELKSDIQNQLANTKNEYVAFRLLRKNFYFGNHEWPTIEKLERLFQKNSLEKWHGDVHETPVVTGEVGELEGYLLHYTHRDLTSMVNKTIEWSKIESELRYKAHHPKMAWWRFFRVMSTAFYDSYIKQRGYKAGTAGVVESIYQMFSMFITYASLWEKQQNELKSKR
jgi:glycosyltransferase involved in cell wall biosynthesis